MESRREERRIKMAYMNSDTVSAVNAVAFSD
jgi:hypothetical protein